MDFPIHVLRTSQGVPIYFEEFPEFFRPMAIKLVIYSGGADDCVLNAPGIHHWGEHIPFRGTIGYPEGSKQIMGRAAELGGRISAYTNHYETVYYAHAPKSDWLEAASIVVDLAARPLLKPQDIEAERKIIGQEISQGNGNIDRRNYKLLRRALWDGHPMGNTVIGTHESLAATSIDTIEKMRTLSYGLKRCVLFVAGAIKPQEVLEYLSQLLERMPNNPIEERRMPASYGKLPAWKPGETEIEESEFDPTIVTLAFPVQSDIGDEELIICNSILMQLLSTGSLSSPLYRIVREQRQLAYSTSMLPIRTMDGGMMGLTASTSREKADAVINAFWDVLSDAEVCSDKRWQFVQNSTAATFNMYLPDPRDSVERLQNNVERFGKTYTLSESLKRLHAAPRARVMEILDSLTKERGRAIMLRGRK